MKIVHVCLGFPVDYPGGITNYVRALLASQQTQGHDVHVVSRSPNGVVAGGAINHEWVGSAVPFDLKVAEDPVNTGSLIELLRRIAPDIIHFHITIDLNIDFYRTFPDLSPSPYIVSLHDYYYLCPRIYLMDYRGRTCSGAGEKKCAHCVGVLDQVDVLRRIGHRFNIPLPRVASSRVNQRQEAMRHFLGRSRRVLAVSERVRELYGAFFGQSRIDVLHIGNESAHHAPYERSPSQQLRLTFMGTLNRHKGAEVLQHLASSVRRSDLIFSFYGRADRRWRERLEPLGVRFMGSYRPEDIPRIMADTDLGLALPVWEDNGPQVVMEFINYGVPVLATRMGGIPDFVTEQNAVLFDPFSPAERTRVVQWIQQLTHPEVARMAAHAQRLLTPEDHARQLFSVYQDA